MGYNLRRALDSASSLCPTLSHSCPTVIALPSIASNLCRAVSSNGKLHAPSNESFLCCSSSLICWSFNLYVSGVGNMVTFIDIGRGFFILFLYLNIFSINLFKTIKIYNNKIVLKHVHPKMGWIIEVETLDWVEK